MKAIQEPKQYQSGITSSISKAGSTGYFIEPAVNPLMKWRCKNSKATTAGIATKVEKAIIVSHWVLYMPMN
jgi:hypothetical protein